MTVTPWWEATSLRDEVVRGGGVLEDVQMSLHRAVYGSAGEFPPYSNATYYGEITHPGTNLVELMARVAARLAGASGVTATALWRLDQSMGGGKSHGLIGLWHLAAHVGEFRQTEIGRRSFEEASKMAGTQVAQPDSPVVVVLSGDNMTPGVANPDIDGPATTLHERFLWQLFSHDHTLFRRYQPFHADKARLADALRAVEQPVLILVDEILDYVRQLSEPDRDDVATRDMGFMRALLDTVNDVPKVAAVVVMISSEKDSIALNERGQAMRAELEDLLTRNGTTATVTSNTDFGAILRRRLLEGSVPGEVVEATARAYRDAVTQEWRKILVAAEHPADHEWAQEVARCYPFHPLLISLAEQEWARQAGFQRVRSTIQIFAATLFALQRRGQDGQWCPLLIGPGDLPLSVSAVREALIGSGLIPVDRDQANYRQVAAADIVGDDDRSGSARQLDLSRQRANWTEGNPRAAERMATALFLHSIIGTRAQGRRGATEPEVKAAAFVADPWFSHVDAEAVLGELADEHAGLASLERIEGRGGQPARLFLSTRKTLTMHFRSMRASVSDADRDTEIARLAEKLASSGPFNIRFIEDTSGDRQQVAARELLADIDDRSVRLVVLDPRRFTLLNGADQETRAAIEAAMGIGPRKLPVSWGPSAVFVAMNTQRRRLCREKASDLVAWKRVVEIDAVRRDPDELERADTDLRNVRRDLERAVERAYQHILFVEQSAGGDGRECKEIRLESERESALHGSTVWAKLVEHDRALPDGGLTAKALLANLNEDDFGRPLDEVVKAFWGTPRMPLIFGGEREIQNAIYGAIMAGDVWLVGPDGDERAVSQARDVPLQSTSIRLARPEPKPPTLAETPDERSGTGSGGDSNDTEHVEREREDVLLSFSLRTAVGGEPARRTQLFGLLSRLAEMSDEGTIEHLEMTAKIALPRPDAEALDPQIKNLGGNPTSTPL